MRRLATNEAGFGLIELLIAMTVMVIAITAILAGFSSGIAAIPTPDQIRTAFPDIDPALFLGTYIERAKTTLRIGYRDMDWFEQTPWFQYARVGRKYAEAAGYRLGVVRNGERALRA